MAAFEIHHMLFCILMYFGSANGNCMLSMKLDLSYNQPLIISPYNEMFYSMDNSPMGTLQLSRDETVKFACPTLPRNSFARIPSQDTVIAKCISGNKFEVDKNQFTFEQLQCASPVTPSVKRTGKECGKANTELINVGYEYEKKFITVYSACYDKETKGTVYTEVDLNPSVFKNDAPVREGTYEPDTSLYGNADFANEYSCARQAATFQGITGKKWAEDERCCFKKAQLVTPQDLTFGTQQLATYHYLNTIPQWSTCNTENWIEVENRIRNLVHSLQRPLKVWSGTFRTVEARSKWLIFTKDLYLHYNSKSDKSAPVPLYIWKVVHDPQTRKSLAIITINKPSLTIAEVESYVLCPDICHNVNWMNFMRRQTISSGYVYCCDLNDFAFSFQFKREPFPERAGKILRDE